ncbi:MAG: SPOCS domain-containing protein [Oscillospiraceae bacterium]
MNFKVNREIFSSNEVVFDGSSEQSIELDYILPDYFPDVFRVLKCRMSPRIVSHSISSEKLTYELVVGIRVLYMSENSHAVRSVEQKMTFSKTVEMGKSTEKPLVVLIPKTDYINCRVVNQRRLDFRGAVSIKAKVSGERKQEMVTDAFGAGIQLKKELVSYPVKRLTAMKRATIIEQLDMGETKPPIISIIRSEATVMLSEQKIIMNKLIAKGETSIGLLYTCEKDGADSLEAMHFALPFSQIIDVDGISERFEATIAVSVVNCEIIPRGSGGETREAECEINVLLECTAYSYENIEMVTDAYSTNHPCEYKVCDTRIDKKPVPICESHSLKTVLEYIEGDITCVYEAWAKITGITSRLDTDKGAFVFSGSCCVVVMAKNDCCCPVYLEAEVPFEHILSMENLCSDSYAEQRAAVTSCSYNMTSTNSVEVKAEIKIYGCIFEASCSKLISEITVDESVKKEHEESCALKLYFAQSGERVWGIAKRYNTSVNAIMEENELSGDTLSQRGMLLIPIIS